MPPKTGKGLWKAIEMPTPKNYGPRIRPVESWSTTFDPNDPSTWRSGAGRAAMEAAEADDPARLVAVLQATPFVKFVIDFAEQLDAAARKKAAKTAAVLLPWCDVEAWRQCLLISAQLSDTPTLNLLLCDVDQWPQHDRFRQQVTGDEYHPAANPSLVAGAAAHREATPYRERETGGEESLFDTSDFVVRGPWQRRRLLDVLPACGGGRHLVLQRSLEAACRAEDLDLLHAAVVLAMEPAKAVPFGAAAWQPRCNHWVSAGLERQRSACGCAIVQCERKLGKLANFEAEASEDFLGAALNVGQEDSEDKAANAAAGRARQGEELATVLARKRELLMALDYYLAVLHGGAAAHPHRHHSLQRERLAATTGGGLGGGGGGGGGLPANPPHHIGHRRTSASEEGLEKAAAAVANATLEVVRFDRRVPMRDRCRNAGDHPAWRGYVPQWTGEGGAHRVWRHNLGKRSQMLSDFNRRVAGSLEKPPEIEGGAL